MKTYGHFWKYVAEYFLASEIFQTKFQVLSAYTRKFKS